MAKQKPFQDEISSWTTEKRIEFAQDRVNQLTYRIQDILELHAANEIIQYSNDLSVQIPRSLAAHAFTSFQDAQFKYEIIRLAALWERAQDNVVSIPVVIAAIDSTEVIENLVDATYDAHANTGYRHLNPHDDPAVQKQIDEMMAASQREFAKEQSGKAADILAKSIDSAKAVVRRQETTSLRNLRDYAAHSLTATRRDSKSKTPPMKYGEETELLDTTITLVENLYSWVNGTSFDISGDCFSQARRHARELWLNCTFSVPDRR